MMIHDFSPLIIFVFFDLLYHLAAKARGEAAIREPQQHISPARGLDHPAGWDRLGAPSDPPLRVQPGWNHRPGTHDPVPRGGEPPRRVSRGCQRATQSCMVSNSPAMVSRFRHPVLAKAPIPCLRILCRCACRCVSVAGAMLEETLAAAAKKAQTAGSAVAAEKGRKGGPAGKGAKADEEGKSASGEEEEEGKSSGCGPVLITLGDRDQVTTKSSVEG